jgi:hypothetical protein
VWWFKAFPVDQTLQRTPGEYLRPKFVIIAVQAARAMDFPKQFLSELFKSDMQNSFVKILPEIVKETFCTTSSVARQEFIALDEAYRRDSLSRKTLYNYHKRST